MFTRIKEGNGQIIVKTGTVPAPPHSSYDLLTEKKPMGTNNPTHKQIKQGIIDIELLAKLVDLSSEKIPKNRPSGLNDSEVAGLYLLRDEVPYYDLLRDFPSQEVIIEYLQKREEFKPQIRLGTIGEMIKYGPLEIDSKLRFIRNGVWGMADSFPDADARELMNGEKISNFQQFLYELFKPFLLLEFKGIINPFRKITNTDAQDGQVITTQKQKVMRADFWDCKNMLLNFKQYAILPRKIKAVPEGIKKKKCFYCGKTFYTDRNNRIYCNPNCQKKNKQENYRKNKAKRNKTESKFTLNGY